MEGWDVVSFDTPHSSTYSPQWIYVGMKWPRMKFYSQYKIHFFPYPVNSRFYEGSCRVKHALQNLQSCFAWLAIGFLILNVLSAVPDTLLFRCILITFMSFLARGVADLKLNIKCSRKKWNSPKETTKINQKNDYVSTQPSIHKCSWIHIKTKISDIPNFQYTAKLKLSIRGQDWSNDKYENR
jgi:hypothetical protein